MSELIRFGCSSCGKRLKATTEQAGRRARCSCGEAVVVPANAELVTAPVAESAGGNRWLIEPPTITAIQVTSIDRTMSGTPAIPQQPWMSVVSGAPEHAFVLRYRGDIRAIWQSITEYVQKLPDLTVLETTAEPLKLVYQSKHFRQIIVVRLALASKTGEADIFIQLFDDLTQPETVENKNPMMKMFAYAALKTHALDPKFRQTGGVGGPNEVRSSGVWKMVGGAVLCLAGLILTAMTNGQVLFYGAIIWGGFLLIAGLAQTIIGRKVD